MFLITQSHLLLLLFAVLHFLCNTRAALNKVYVAIKKDGITTGNANCNAAEIAALRSALIDAKTLADAAVRALSVPNSFNSQAFIGWFGWGNTILRDEIKQNNFQAVSAALSINDINGIDWDDRSDPWTAPVEPGSLVIFCESGPPWRTNQICAAPRGIAGVYSYPTRDRSALPYARLALCPRFFTLGDFNEAGRLWALDKSNFMPTRGGTLLHEAQHIHLIVSDQRWCDDVQINNVRGGQVKCYSPESCWDWLAPYPLLKRGNAQNYRFFAQDAAWAPSRVAPPYLAAEGLKVRESDNNGTLNMTADALHIDSSRERNGIFLFSFSPLKTSLEAPLSSSPSDKPSTPMSTKSSSSTKPSTFSTSTTTRPTFTTSFTTTTSSSTASTASTSFTTSSGTTTSSTTSSGTTSSSTSSTISLGTTSSGTTSSSTTSSGATSSGTTSSSTASLGTTSSSTASSSTASSSTASSSTTSSSTASSSTTSSGTTSSGTTSSSTASASTTSTSTSSTTSSDTTSSSTLSTTSSGTTSSSTSSTTSSSTTSSSTSSTTSSGTTSSPTTISSISQRTTTIMSTTISTEYIGHGHTTVAYSGEVIVGGAGGGFYELGGIVYYLMQGQTETAGDPDNVPTSTLSLSISSPSSSTTKSPSSSSSSTSRQFVDPWNNAQEDVNVYQLNPSECSRLSIICFPKPPTSDAISTTTSTTLSTSSFLNTVSVTVTDAITTETTSAEVVTLTIMSTITQQVTSATTTIWVPDPCSCVCLSTPNQSGCPDCCPQCPRNGVNHNYPRTSHEVPMHNSQSSSLMKRIDNYKLSTTVVTEIIIRSISSTVTTTISDTTTDTITSSSTLTTTSLTTTTSTITGFECIVCEPGTC